MIASFGGSDALGLLHDGNGNRGASLDEAFPLMDNGAHAADANFDLSDFFQNSF